MAIKIVDYSTYPQYITKCGDGNVSDIMDRLIRIAAKITEHFAGDIYFDIDSLLRSIEEGKPYDKILCFRECGVNTFNIEHFEECNYMSLDGYIQFWRLKYDLESTDGYNVRLWRVNVTRV